MGKGSVVLGEKVKVGKHVAINVSERLEIGDRSTIGDYFEIEGRNITIGREFWSGRFCGIGGGSCFEKPSLLEIGDQCHLGDFGFINTARKVVLGNEVGLGQHTKIYTHGVYLSMLQGFPVKYDGVTLEDRVWCPNAIIMPGVTVGHDTVVGAGSVVTKSLPPNCLALGVPAKVTRENCFPALLSLEEKEAVLDDFLDHFRNDILDVSVERLQSSLRVKIGSAMFDLDQLSIRGRASVETEKFKDELRRFGVRFRYFEKKGKYVEFDREEYGRL